jgi:hypothetical protein
MRTSKYQIIGLLALSFIFGGFMGNNPEPAKATPVVQSNALIALISHSNWGASLISSSKDKAGLKTIKITFGEELQEVFYVKNTKTSKTIYETTGANRAIVIDNAAGTVSVTENGAPATFNSKTYQDIMVAAAVDIDGDVTYFTHRKNCTSTVVAIAPQKSESVQAVQNFATDYLKSYPDCGQIGDVKTSGVWEEKGSVSFTAFVCKKTGCE